MQNDALPYTVVIEILFNIVTCQFVGVSEEQTQKEIDFKYKFCLGHNNEETKSVNRLVLAH